MQPINACLLKIALKNCIKFFYIIVLVFLIYAFGADCIAAGKYPPTIAPPNIKASIKVTTIVITI